jgi:hypothetical protein
VVKRFIVVLDPGRESIFGSGIDEFGNAPCCPIVEIISFSRSSASKFVVGEGKVDCARQKAGALGYFD